VDRIVLGAFPVTIGVVANTHGVISSGVLDALRGCDLVVHAGDIGHVATLEALRAVGRVVAVRGNSDRVPPLRELPDAVEITAGAVRMLALHNHAALEWSPDAEGFHVIISGLWHQPSVKEQDGMTVVSPGSAAPGWPGMPTSLARIVVTEHGAQTRLVWIESDPGGIAHHK